MRWHPAAFAAMIARTRPVPVSAEPSRPSPILHARICAPGATPDRDGSVSKCAATMPATCVPWEPASVTMHSRSPSWYTCTQKESSVPHPRSPTCRPIRKGAIGVCAARSPMAEVSTTARHTAAGVSPAAGAPSRYSRTSSRGPASLYASIMAPNCLRRSSRSFLAAALAAPVTAPASKASISRCTAVTAACCVASKLALRSRLTRPRTERGSSEKRRTAPSRISAALSAHEPSRSVRPDSPVTLPSGSRAATVLVSMSPPPVQSRKSTYLGRPSLVCSRPAAARSHPVSKIATRIPRPSASG
mmetsp:Transcript_23237/g.75275  ORF Transcript_23237/g.75275 Transcript_23237/m.75275 type:complete len:303 (-) Transcript_23237:127-1035(-)